MLISIFSKLDIIAISKNIISQLTGISIDDQLTFFNLEFGFVELLLLLVGVLTLFGILAQNIYNSVCIQVRPLISDSSTSDYYTRNERNELWIKYIRHALFFMLCILILLFYLMNSNKNGDISNIYIIIFLYSWYLLGKCGSCILFACLNLLVEYIVGYPKENIKSSSNGNELVLNPTNKAHWSKFGQVLLSISILVTPVFVLLWNTLKPEQIISWFLVFIFLSFIIAVGLVDKVVLKNALKNILTNPITFIHEYIKQHLLIFCGTVLNRKELEVYKETKDYYKYVGKVIIIIVVFVYSLSSREVEHVEAASDNKVSITLSVLPSTIAELEKMEQKTGLNTSAIIDEIFSE